MRNSTRVVTSRKTTIDDLLPKFLIYFDASRNITMATSTNISQWVDRVSGLVASQTTSSAQPLINNTAGNLYVSMSQSNIRFLTINIPTPLNINTSQAYFCFSNAVFSCTVSIPNNITSLEIGRNSYPFFLNSIIIFNGFPTPEEDLRIIEFLKTKLAYNSQNLSVFDSASNTFLIGRRITNISSAFFAGITDFSSSWQNCNGLTSFPLLDTSNGTDFINAWRNCTGLTSFTLLNTSKSTNFNGAWQGCTELTSFPANFFDNWVGNPVVNCFWGTWFSCTKLTAQSVENILVSIAFSGKSAPAGATGAQTDITITYATSTGSLSTVTTNAITTLKSRGWKPTINGTYV